MGAYVYKITAKRVKLSDGREANVSKYAYKPYHGWDSDKANSKFHFRTGCSRADSLAEKGSFTGLIVSSEPKPGDPVYSFVGGSFVDDSFDWTGRKVEGVTVAA